MKKIKIISYTAAAIMCLVIAAGLMTDPYESSAASHKDSIYCGDSAFVSVVKKLTSAGGKTDLSGGRTFYVSTDGSDDQPGTAAEPFATFKHALSRLSPGSTLYIKGGTYTEPLNIGSSTGGSAGRYITIASAPGEKAVLSGRGRRSVLASINGASYIRISGLDFSDADGQDSCGINVASGANHIIIDNCEMHDIRVPDPAGENHCANCILMEGSSSTRSINNVLVYKNSMHDCSTGWSECLSVTGNTKYINAVANTICRTGNIGIDFSGNYGYCRRVSVDFPRHCLIYKNRVSRCVSAYGDTAYGIYTDGGQYIRISRNRIERCSGGIEAGAERKARNIKYAAGHIIISSNTLAGNIDNAITVGGWKRSLGWVQDVYIVRNNCVDNGVSNAVLTLSKCRRIHVRSNRFCNTGGHADVVYAPFSEKYTGRIYFKNNIYCNGGSSKNTDFVWHGREYDSFAKWKKASADRGGRYGGR